MNILFLDQFTAIGGGQRSLLDLLPLVRARGWQARIALPGEGTFAEMIRARGFPVDFFHWGAYTPSRKRLADFMRFVRDTPGITGRIAGIASTHRIDLIYVNGPRLLAGAALVSRAKSIPLVFHCHHRLFQPTAVRLAGEALRWSRGRLIACCQFAAEPLERYTSRERRRTIYNGVPRPSWVRRTRGPLQPWNIGVVGRIEPEKGQMEFVAAARILSSEFSDCRYLLAGAPLFSGPEYCERVKAASRDLPFEFLGWQDDIGAAFSQLDLLAVPSTDIDSTPRVVIEAFAGGLPVVAFPSGGIPEIVQDGRTGFLAEAQSPFALASRIKSVRTMGRQLLREVSDRAQATWKEKYTLDRFHEEVGEVIAAAGS